MIFVMQVRAVAVDAPAPTTATTAVTAPTTATTVEKRKFSLSLDSE